MSEHFTDSEQFLKDMVYFYEYVGKKKRRKRKRRG